MTLFYLALAYLLISTIAIAAFIKIKPKNSAASNGQETAQSLSSDIQRLKEYRGVLSVANSVLLFLAALSATLLVVASRLSDESADDQSELQGRLDKLRDDRFSNDLKEKERSIEKLHETNLATETKLESERQARLKAEESVAWRRLSKERKAEIENALSKFAGQMALLQYNANDQEAYSFALDITSALHLAHWSASEPLAVLKLLEGPVPLGTNPPLASGITIISTEDEASRNASDALFKVLTACGFDAQRRPKNESRPNSIVFIWVEHRPEGAQGDAKLRHAHK